MYLFELHLPTKYELISHSTHNEIHIILQYIIETSITVVMMYIFSIDAQYDYHSIESLYNC